MSKTRTDTERKSKSRKTSDVLEINDKNLIGDDVELREMVEAATLNAVELRLVPEETEASHA